MALTEELSNWLLKIFLGQPLETHIDSMLEMIEAFNEDLTLKEEEGLKVYDVGDFTFLTELVGHQRLQFNVDIESYTETLPHEFLQYEGRRKLLGEWCGTIDGLMRALNASENLKASGGHRPQNYELFELKAGDDDNMLLIKSEKDYENWYRRIQQQTGGMVAARMTLEAKFYVRPMEEGEDDIYETEMETPEPRANHYRGFSS